MTSHPTRTATALVAAVTMLSVLAGSAVAAVPGPPAEDLSFAERGITALGVWDACEAPDADGATRCEMTQAFVFTGRQHNNDEFGHANAALSYLCLYHQMVTLDASGELVEPPLIEQGCSDDPRLTVVDTLVSVSASAPGLELTEELCTVDPDTGGVSCEPGSSRTVAVEAAYTGIGSVESDRWNNRSRTLVDGVRCTFASSGSGVMREATASLTIDGSNVGPSAFAHLNEGRNRFSQRCG